MKGRALCYRAPAKAWTQALPLGNGRLGAMIYGDPLEEKADLNLDTLWSGDGHCKENPAAAGALGEIRGLIKKGEREKAEEQIKGRLLGDWTESFLPAASLKIRLPFAKAGEYSRSLFLGRALFCCGYTAKGNRVEEEAFVSAEDGILLLRMRAEKPFDAQISLESLLQHMARAEENGILLTGRAPVYAAPSYFKCEQPIRYEQGKGMRFAVFLSLRTQGGQVTAAGKSLQVCGATAIELRIAGATDFEQQENFDCPSACRRQLQAAEKQSFEQLLARHEQRFSALFGRVSIDLGGEPEEPCDTAEVLGRVQQEPELTAPMAALLYDYGRYLLISASFPGSECANLQGIWNAELRAPWSGNYTVNINTEMNYWMAEMGALPECHLPLFQMLQRAARRGEKTAREIYGLPGWVTHHNIDLWGHSSPVGGPADDNPCRFAIWPMSGGWLCRHLWEHYLFTGDRDFLRETAYPLMRGAAEFYLSYLCEYNGQLVTSPSTSPENTFVGEDKKEHAVSIACTMDVAILRELFSFFPAACRELAIEDPLAREAERAAERLPGFQIGRHGQLQEWLEDFEEIDPHHRHVSPLYALYPAQLIRPQRDRQLAEACRVFLERRGDEGTGWSIAWKACLWARLGDGERAEKLLRRQLRLTEQTGTALTGGGTYPNGFCAHPPFQIDGNFGFAAAVGEMLLQSGEGEIQLLPALPAGWGSGSVKGLRASGGFAVSFSWEKGRVICCEVSSLWGGSCTVLANGNRYPLDIPAGEKRSLSF
ncbi:MAG: glycoside hydrolase family 95 protein [Provencibacterium sp.]|jgi:alpha-L-fucosidase 2|nr:glycoside hydrolase family 95 protein [Provencibacterium sp.]